MKWWMTVVGTMVSCAPLWGDEMALTDGTKHRGTFGGFRDHQFVLADADGREHRAFAADVGSIRLDAPVTVSSEFIGSRLENASFTGYSQFKLRFLKDGEDVIQPVILLKRMDPLVETAAGDNGGAPPPDPAPAVGKAPATVSPPRDRLSRTPPRREWQQSGRWREMPSKEVTVISNGETVDIAQSLKRGVANVVHFHMSSAHSSVRQGNYLETLAQRSGGRLAIRRVNADWKSPICEALNIDSLPQFWFYSRSGRLQVKLVARFTDSDIETAVKDTMKAE